MAWCFKFCVPFRPPRSVGLGRLKIPLTKYNVARRAGKGSRLGRDYGR